MADFFKFRETIEEAKCASKREEKLDPVGKADDDIDNDGDVDSSDEYLKNRRKAIKKSMKKEDADGPCWKGYKQVGTKMKNGKEVPNCVPMDEAKEQMDEAKVTDDHWAIVKRNGNFYTSKSEIVKTMKPSKNPPSEKVVSKHGGDAAVRVGKLKKDLEGKQGTDKLMKQLSEGYYDQMPEQAYDMAQTQLHFIKYAADDITRCIQSGCPMPEWYQNKLAKMEGDMEGLYSYMKGKTRKMKARQADRYGMGMGMYSEQTLTEAKSGDKEAYKKFFDKALDKYGVDSPADLDKDKKKEFFDYVDKNWKADDEKTESVKIDENLRKVKVTYSDGTVIKTDMAKNLSDRDIKDYFKVGSTVNLGSGGKDKLVKVKKVDILESTISEKLNPSDDVSKWIEDFYKSDAPQFKGKSKEERREMALAAWIEAREKAGIED